ncbi:MAG: hypothetical protein GY871_04040 [Actinomycetales bacterium]|nr:hypothetical protein [Actinomycetales bacterium]
MTKLWRIAELWREGEGSVSFQLGTEKPDEMELEVPSWATFEAWRGWSVTEHSGGIREAARLRNKARSRMREAQKAFEQADRAYAIWFAREGLDADRER